MHVGKCADRLLSRGANTAWKLLQAVNRRISAGTFQPKWAPGPALKSTQCSSPRLGWPRTTDSLCPECVKEARKRILNGHVDIEALLHDHVGEIEAQILERDGQVIIEKICPLHGRFTDTLSINPAFMARIEKLFPGRDYTAVTDNLHNHGTSSIKYGRGSVLTIDLTNRCNMMCDPCFMDANQVGYVHELTLPEVQKILDDAVSVKPRRQLTVQFSGGEPTLSPIFLDAVAYSKKLGYFSAQAATNGVRFAEDPAFALQARQAGLRIAYLQFDGIGEANNAHRKIANLFEVKLRAIENLHTAGIDVALVVTVIKTVNDHQVGPIIRFAVENSDKVSFVSFQPVSFTGRDEDIDDVTRHRQRYTLSHLAEDVKQQTGVTEPLSDWFPLSATSGLSDVSDLIAGPSADWGTLKCGCHPNCGVGTALFVNKRTKEWVPISQFLDFEGLLNDAALIADAARGPWWSKVYMGLSLLRHYRPESAPPGLRLQDFIKKFDKQSGGTLGGLGTPADEDRKGDEWLVLFIAGMWFQDLWTYDFRRTEMCIIPYGTQLGEISFCAYNTGVGWRHIIEKMYQNATIADWYKEHGKHPVYANPGKSVPLPDCGPSALSTDQTGAFIPLASLRKQPLVQGLAQRNVLVPHPFSVDS